METLLNLKSKELNKYLCFICQKRKKGSALYLASDESILKLKNAVAQRTSLGEKMIHLKELNPLIYTNKMFLD